MAGGNADQIRVLFQESDRFEVAHADDDPGEENHAHVGKAENLQMGRLIIVGVQRVRQRQRSADDLGQRGDRGQQPSQGHPPTRGRIRDAASTRQTAYLGRTRDDVHHGSDALKYPIAHERVHIQKEVVSGQVHVIIVIGSRKEKQRNAEHGVQASHDALMGHDQIGRGTAEAPNDPENEGVGAATDRQHGTFESDGQRVDRSFIRKPILDFVVATFVRRVRDLGQHGAETKTGKTFLGCF